jgi:3-ketosteroid 9alpha-monooxygenase subunit B
MKPAHSLSIVQVIPQGTEAVLVSFGPDSRQAPHFTFEPGQYLTLAVNVNGNEEWRCYSITSESAEGEPISVLVRRVQSGLVSNWICDHARPADYMRVLPPAGRFTLARRDRAVLLFAGGSGIAPIFALARYALAQGAPRVSLFYANRDRASAMLMAELDELRQRAGVRLEVRFWYDAEQGLPSQDDLQRHVTDPKGCDVYLCGPEPFMLAAAASMTRAGCDPACMHREIFSSGGDAPGENDGSGMETLLTVKMRGKTHTVTVKGHESLLSAMLKAGLPAPHACKVGECASCVCHLESGEVERLGNSVLDEDDVASGLLLACSTCAHRGRVSVRFD